MPDRLGRLAPRVFFCFLALVILGPILRSGYIFTLDFVGGPRPFLETSNFASSVIQYVFFWLGPYVAAGWFIQKLALFLILLVSGLSMYYCVPVRSTGAKYFAGFLYVVNPFVFTRMEAGHVGLLAAYACLPFAVKAVLAFLRLPKNKTAVAAGAWLGFLSLLSLHAVMAWIPFAIGLFVYFFEAPVSERDVKKMFAGTVVAIGVFLFVSAGWIIPMILGVSSLSGISGSQAGEFATRADVFYGLIPNVAAMQGFWQSELVEPKMFEAVWIVPFLGILGISVLGLVSALRDDGLRPAALIVGISALIGIILALGVSSQATAWLYRLLFDLLPGFRGFREPQKFIALAAFAYAFLGAIGIGRLLSGRSEAAKAGGMLATGIAFILVGFYTFPIFWGLTGNVRVADYPSGWHKAEAAMGRDSKAGRILFIPWHLYMKFDFTGPGSAIANPAHLFFAREVLSGKNIELRGTYSSSGDPEQKKTESLLRKGSDGVSVAAPFRAMGVRYIVLAKDADWRAYKWLYKNCGLYPVLDDADIAVFRTGR